MTTYKTVKTAEFATSVYNREICWNIFPPAKKKPNKNIFARIILKLDFIFIIFLNSKIKKNGNKAKKPNSNLAAEKVQGPM